LSDVDKISQGSVATRARCDGLFNDDFITNLLNFTAEFASERILKIRQY